MCLNTNITFMSSIFFCLQWNSWVRPLSYPVGFSLCWLDLASKHLHFQAFYYKGNLIVVTDFSPKIFLYPRLECEPCETILSLLFLFVWWKPIDILLANFLLSSAFNVSMDFWLVGTNFNNFLAMNNKLLTGFHQSTYFLAAIKYQLWDRHEKGFLHKVTTFHNVREGWFG